MENLVIFEDLCPCCGEICDHEEDEEFESSEYKITCHQCGFKGSWKSVLLYEVWLKGTAKKREKAEHRRAKNEAKLLNRYEREE